MIENLRKIILNRIAEVIKRVDYEGVYADGKRPALEELEVLNKLLQNISETDLVKKEMYIKYLMVIVLLLDVLDFQKSQHLVVNVLTILNLYGQEKC